MKKLKGRKVLITGGARGIGKEIALGFVKAGCDLMICSRNEAELEKTSKELAKFGSKVFYKTADVSNFKDCQKLFRFVKKKFNSLDVLVNNAGIYGPIGFVETNDANDWSKTIEINLLGTVYCTQEALKIMKKQKSGKIINLAGGGVGGKKPLSRFSAYFVSKAAVATFTEVIAAESAGDNIQINAISPGAVNTYFTEYLLAQGRDKAGEKYDQALKQKTTGGDSPQLAANLCLFLASQESNNITGKLLSAKWDKQAELKKLTPKNNSRYTLRRIDEDFFYEK